MDAADAWSLLAKQKRFAVFQKFDERSFDVVLAPVAVFDGQVLEPTHGFLAGHQARS